MNLFREKKSKSFTTRLLLILLSLIIILGLILIIIFNFKSYFLNENQTTKLGFEDISQLDTESCITTNIGTIDESRNLFGVTIPFTQSKYIYSYDVTIKAGINFDEIKYNVDDTNKKITIKLPQAQITSCAIDENSFKVYYEKESIFKKITLKQTNSSFMALKKNAQQTAIDNGILDNAETNAQKIITEFVGQAYNLDEYEVVYY
jgi:hypothetical protein